MFRPMSPDRSGAVPLGALVGRTCDGAGGFTVGGSATFRFGDAVLQVECLWRIVQGGILRLTSQDHGHPYGRGTAVDAPAEADERLRGRKVTGIAGGSVEADVVLTLDDDLRLEIAPDSSGYESWHFTMPGTHLVGVGDGRILRI
jgi:hypothetical protein